jgi:protein phosphatase
VPDTSDEQTDSLPVRIASRTDIGLRRKRNEDFLGSEQTPHGMLFVVCDGMGGHAGGDRASRLAVEEFLRYVRNAKGEPSNVLRNAVISANDVVYHESQASREHAGMGTTLVGALISGSRATVVNLGDSRGYHYTRKRLFPVTSDHSLVGELLQQGQITAEEARVHPQRNIITRALGLQESSQPDVFTLDLQDGDALLLCSDGLNGMVTDAEMERIIARNPGAQQACDQLVDAALEAGGVDNVTVILVCVGSSAGSGQAEVSSDTVELPSKRKGNPTAWVLVPIAIIIAAILWFGWLNDTTPVADDAVQDTTNMFADSVGDADSIFNNDSILQLTPGEMVDSLEHIERNGLPSIREGQQHSPNDTNPL